MEIKFDIKFTQGQIDAIKSFRSNKTKYLMLNYSRQSGKSVFAETILIQYLCKTDKFSAYVSPTFQLGRKVFKEITQLLEGKGIIKKSNASTLTIESVFGSVLQFFSVEAYTAIRGFTISGVLICDECAYYPDILPNGEQIWGNVLMPITKARCKKIVLISTPRGKRGFFYDFCMRAMNKEKGFRYLKRTIFDDTLISPQDIEEIKKVVPEIAFKQEFECEFLDNALTFFNGFERCFKKDVTHSYHKTWIGVDLSGDGKDETILTKINEENVVEQFKILGTLDQKYKQIADIVNNSTNLQYSFVEINGLGAPMLNEIKKLVKNKHKLQPWTTTNSSKEEILSELAVKIANNDIIFNEKDTELYSQFGTFTSKFSKTGKLQLMAQDGYKDDRIMSLAIALKAKTSLKPAYTDNDFVVIDVGKMSKYDIR